MAHRFSLVTILQLKGRQAITLITCTLQPSCPVPGRKHRSCLTWEPSLVTLISSSPGIEQLGRTEEAGKRTHVVPLLDGWDMTSHLFSLSAPAWFRRGKEDEYA